MLCVYCFFFFKQKTAYEMRIGDWSSDVCSSDLTLTLLPLVLFKLDHKINKFPLPWVNAGEHRSPAFAAWGERLWRRPVIFGLGSLVVLVALAAPILEIGRASCRGRVLHYV